MRCPRCEDIVLDEIDRDGVTVDRCSGCRGIWLDRGELEKIIARAGTESEHVEGNEPHREREPTPGQRKQKRSFWLDLFD